ncbi:hypothetical protein IAU59_005420 [Kwoniella sp. CBS 9459]
MSAALQSRPAGPRTDEHFRARPQPLHTIPLHQSSPTSPTRHSSSVPDHRGAGYQTSPLNNPTPHSPRHQEWAGLSHTHHTSNCHHPLSPRHHHTAHETDPMLSPQRRPHEMNNSHLHPQRPQEVHIDPRHSHVVDDLHSPVSPGADHAGDTNSAPAPQPKSPKSPTSMSKRLLFALTHKAPISRTWEKKSFTDHQGAIPRLEGRVGNADPAEYDLGDLNTPRSRPMSFYASPAEIAAFKPLPFVEGPHQHHHSAPVTPAPTARG